jgi:protein involved in polysaccharide export with SLBB domain
MSSRTQSADVVKSPSDISERPPAGSRTRPNRSLFRDAAAQTTSLLAGALILAAAGAVMDPHRAAAASGTDAVPLVDQANLPYRLGPLDKIKVRAFEWRPSQDDIFEWKSLNTEYVIGATGNVAVPLIGEIKAEGLTTPDLSDVIARQLRHRLGLAQGPDVSVEVVAYRPFYIAGYVQRSGEYDYRPGMTVLQAVAIAGGLQKGNEADSKRLQRDLISTQGDMSVLNGEFKSLLARKARLQADFFNLRDIEFPADLTSNTDGSDISALMQQERVYFETRKQAMESQLNDFQNLKQFLVKERVSLESQLTIHARRMQLVRQELTTVLDLFKKGMVTAPHKLSLERSYAELDSQRIRMELDVMRSSEEMTRVDIAMADLHTRRISEITADMLQTQTRLQEVRQRFTTSARLLQETAVDVQKVLNVSDSATSGGGATYAILRKVEGHAVELAAGEETELRPGDSVKVKFTGSGARHGTLQQASTTLFAPDVLPGDGLPTDDQATRPRLEAAAGRDQVHNN